MPLCLQDPQPSEVAAECVLAEARGTAPRFPLAAGAVDPPRISQHYQWIMISFVSLCCTLCHTECISLDVLHCVSYLVYHT